MLSKFDRDLCQAHANEYPSVGRCLAELEAAEAERDALKDQLQDPGGYLAVGCFVEEINALRAERDALRKELAEAHRVMSEPVQIYCPECGRSTTGYSHGCVICNARRRVRAALEGGKG